MFKIFSAVKKGINSFISSSLEHEEDQSSMADLDPAANKNVRNYNLGDIFPYVVYTADRQETVIDMCKRLAVPPAVLANLNDRDANGSVQVGETFLVPSYSQAKPVRELTVTDLKRYDLEERLTTDPVTPVFYLYYATVHGDILGQLMLTDCELIFDPLNEKFKGIYTYEYGNILDNHKMGFIVHYSDIVGEITKITVPEDEEDPHNNEMNYDIQIAVRHTGNYYYCDPQAKDILDKMSAEEVSPASFNLKVNTNTLAGVKRTSKDKAQQADHFICTLQQKITKYIEKSKGGAGKDARAHSMTSLPFFDIDYPVLMEYCPKKGSSGKGERVEKLVVKNSAESGQKDDEKSQDNSENNASDKGEMNVQQIQQGDLKEKMGEEPEQEIEEELTLEEVDKHIDVIKKIFGLNHLGDSIVDLKNQSMVPLEFLFTGVEDIRREKLEAKGSSEKDFIQAAEEDTRGSRHSTKLVQLTEPEKSDILMDELLPGSELMTRGYAKMIGGCIPAYICSGEWILYYSKKRDGTSYNTILGQCLHRGEVVVVLTDSNQNTFGGYFSGPLEKKDGYFGTGESFLFKYTPDKGVFVYGSTGSNNFYNYCASEGFGWGSDPHFGLFIDQSLVTGSTHACQTFSNDVLSNASHFNLHKLEIWGFKRVGDL